MKFKILGSIFVGIVLIILAVIMYSGSSSDSTTDEIPTEQPIQGQ